VPNGGRINLGAFGGTADAELTAPSTTIGAGGRSGGTPGTDPHEVGRTPTPTPTPIPDHPGITGAGGDDDGGCRVGGRSDGGWLALIVAGWLAARARGRSRRRALPLK
jgi:hypothetical protein